MSEAEKNTREWRVRLDSRSTGPIGWLFAVDVALVEPEDAQEDVIVVPKSALTAALEERDEAKQIIANFTACLEEDPRYVAMRNKAERAEAALTDARRHTELVATSYASLLDSGWRNSAADLYRVAVELAERGVSTTDDRWNTKVAQAVEAIR